MIRHLAVEHVTTYSYDAPPVQALQQLRMTPKSRAGQEVARWDVALDGGRLEVEFHDAHANHVQLVSLDPGATEVRITARGEVAMHRNDGVVGAHGGFMPLWMFLRETALTQQGPGVRRLVRELGGPEDRLPLLHALSDHIVGALPYTHDVTEVGQGAEEVIEAGGGVCTDHAHVFIACARNLGIPARYVSGYLMMNDRVEQEAMHAWAEAHVDGLGWVGFDVSNRHSPDSRYVRVATGLDYGDCAPIHGIRRGAGREDLFVSVAVEETAFQGQSQSQSQGQQQQQQG
jgi:transglutaminase-like putative cysteine protease